MELQFHPASGSGAVRSWKLHDRGQKAVILATGAAAIAAVSLWLTVPAVAIRATRERPSAALEKDGAAARESRAIAERRAAALVDRARDAASLLSKIAFLYRIPQARWPSALNPESGLLSGSPSAAAAGLPRFLLALEQGRSLLEEREAADPKLASRTPSILPLGTELFEPSAVFGPRTSPWTGTEEFFRGLELAAPAGSSALAPADGTVVFAGRVKPQPGTRLWRSGNLVILSHSGGLATLFGHLARIDVSRGRTVRRGERIGTVGTSGWVVSPSLHYEVWRERGGGLAPTDPRFAILDHRLGPPDLSLEKMEATAVPGPIEPLPAP